MPRRKASSGANVYFEIDGLRETQDRLKEISDRFVDAIPFMADAVEIMQVQTAAHTIDNDWYPLAESTVERKESEGLNADIMRDEPRNVGGQATRTPDLLYKALTEANAPGQYRRFSKSSATFGLLAGGHGKLFYARFVSNVKGKHRKLLGFTPRDIGELVEAFTLYIFEDF